MDDYDYQQAVMDDDGAGSAITSTPRERYLDAILRQTLASRYGPAVPVTTAMVSAVAAGLGA